MNPIVFAMRHPITMMVGIVTVVLFSFVALANVLPDHIEVAGPPRLIYSSFVKGIEHLPVRIAG